APLRTPDPHLQRLQVTRPSRTSLASWSRWYGRESRLYLLTSPNMPLPYHRRRAKRRVKKLFASCFSKWLMVRLANRVAVFGSAHALTIDMLGALVAEVSLCTTGALEKPKSMALCKAPASALAATACPGDMRLLGTP